MHRVSGGAALHPVTSQLFVKMHFKTNFKVGKLHCHALKFLLWVMKGNLTDPIYFKLILSEHSVITDRVKYQAGLNDSP